MADPRMYLTYKCELAKATESSSLRAFGNAVGKIGDLEVLNSIGGGKIGQGLRTLSSISNTIRSGCGSLPSSIGSTIESGANWVLSTTGIGPAVVDAVRGFNPQIANQAWGQAKTIYNQVKQGKFTLSSVPGALQDLQNLERLGRNIFTGSGASSMQSVECLASPYAIDLISRAPKHKFLFVVQFTFNFGYEQLATQANEMAFVVKKSTRPNIKFQVEDVNYYNFRSKFVTRTEFEDMSMTFHDDMTNYAMQFYNLYRNAMSPITNMGGDKTDLLNPEGRGMDFSGFLNNGRIVPTSEYSASSAPLYYNDVTILKNIRMFHVYDGGRYMNVFTFHNPRITEMNLDDVDMADSAGNEVTIKFAYDTVHIATGLSANDMLYTNGTSFLPNSTSASLYPLRYNESPGAMKAAHNVPPFGAAGATSSCDPMGEIKTGFVGSIMNSAQKAISSAASSVSNAMNSAFGGVSQSISNFSAIGSNAVTAARNAVSSLTGSLFA